jgi:hypothetical protein
MISAHCNSEYSKSLFHDFVEQILCTARVIGENIYAETVQLSKGTQLLLIRDLRTTAGIRTASKVFYLISNLSPACEQSSYRLQCSQSHHGRTLLLIALPRVGAPPPFPPLEPPKPAGDGPAGAIAAPLVGCVTKVAAGLLCTSGDCDPIRSIEAAISIERAVGQVNRGYCPMQASLLQLI